MKIEFQSLEIKCRESNERITFSKSVTYFHGMISSGKSSIARLIDYCLGGDLEKTPAIRKEVVSVKLNALVGENRVELSRGIEKSNYVEVTWSGKTGSGLVSAPIRIITGASPIWEKSIYNLSDLLYTLAGVRPIMVPRGKKKTDSPLKRLGFRDLMWYCYLEQEHLDSSFFKLKAPILMGTSRDVMRFVVGYYTEQLNKLNSKRSFAGSERKKLESAAAERGKFLDSFGYGSEKELRERIESEKKILQDVTQEMTALRESYRESTHQTDDLRSDLRKKSKELADEEEAIEDLQVVIADQESLRAELVSAKMKHSRFIDAASVLSKVEFESCPICGQKFRSPAGLGGEICTLCRRPIREEMDEPSSEKTMFDKDLEVRIDELTESIKKHKTALNELQRRADLVRKEKQKLDLELDQAIHDYDSRFLGRFRKCERDTATTRERISNLERFIEMLDSIEGMRKRADAYEIEEKELKRKIKEEEASIEAAAERTEEIADEYRQILQAVGVPGIDAASQVELDKSNWIPTIISGEGTKWDFYSAGSAGKKTLLKTCYALSLHVVAAKHNLPLPRFLIIDTPMKNIGEDVNEKLFSAFYSQLYRLAAGPLSKTQIIIIDKEYHAPDSSLGIEVRERFMTTDDKENPPLISYYRRP